MGRAQNDPFLTLGARKNDPQCSASRAHEYESVGALPVASRRRVRAPERVVHARAGALSTGVHPSHANSAPQRTNHCLRAQIAHLALSALTGWRVASHKKTTTPKPESGVRRSRRVAAASASPRARHTRASRRAQYRRPPATGRQRATAHQPMRAQIARTNFRGGGMG